MLRPRAALPGTRAVVGGLLVAVAMVATWWAASGGARQPEGRYVVAARSIGPGQRLEPDDVRVAALDLPGPLRAASITDVDRIVGSVALGPIEEGELLQEGGLAPAAGAPDEREVSFVVEADWAVAGTLRVGDRIDVYATADDPGDEATEVVLTDVTVRSLGSAGDDRLGDRRTQSITVAVTGADEATRLVGAARGATLTVLRVNGTGGGR